MTKKTTTSRAPVAKDDERTTMNRTPGRENPGAADLERTGEDGTVLSAAERAAMLRDEFTQEALPKPPKIPGFHTCWLSTNNSYDPIHKRMRVGYTPVKAEEVAGMDLYKVREGEWDGFISCNEMVLFKIPEEVYQEIMMLFHHTMPMEEEQRIKRQMEDLKKDDRTQTELEEGVTELAVHRPGKFLPD